jgi:threonine dehydrogenase-like Zn-dependent dehydrogenase
MKAGVASPNGLEIRDVPQPQPKATDILVKVRAIALNRADLGAAKGDTSHGAAAGKPIGSEFAGEVVEVGAEVRSLEVGQRVVNASMISDGTCPYCLAGRVTQCAGRSLFGYSGVYPRLDGGQAELVRVPQADRALRPLPEEVTDEAAVFLADILPTGHAAVVRGDVAPGDTVAVVGCGPVGLMALLCARGVADRVLAVDGVPERRRIAEALGAESIDPADAAEAVTAATDGVGADVVIEAAGSPGGLDASLRLARGRGVVSVVGAHFEPDYPLDNALMFERELTLRFSIGDPTADGGLLLDRLASGDLDPTPVVTHRLALDEAAEAYRLFDSREATKVVLHP